MRVARATLRIVPSVIGWVAIVVVLDLAIGAFAGWVSDGGQPVERVEGGQVEVRPGEVDYRADVPAFRGIPWADEYWSEFTRLQTEYVPFLTNKKPDVSYRYFNIEDGVRRSYEPPGLDDDAPTLWFFGGSIAWGEGQRDLHTIPSEVARLAERDGIPLRVRNFGVQSFVSWQAVLQFEQALAHRPAPELAVFFNGTNDLAAQSPGASAQSDDPTMSQLTLTPAAPVPAPFTAAIPRRERTWAEWWADTSAVGRLLGAATSPFAIARAGAAERLSPEGAVMAQRVLDIYERGRVLADALADLHGVEPVHFWQTVPGPIAESPFEAVDNAIAPPTINVTDVYDDVPRDDVFIDEVHTNEVGARMMAERMWETLRPLLESRSESPTG